MRVRTQEVVGEWQRRIEGIKHKIRVCDKMVGLEQDIYSKSFWSDYRRILLHRFHMLVKTHDYVAN